MKPNPQEKCMIIRTIGSLTRSLQSIPNLNEGDAMIKMYPRAGKTKIGFRNASGKEIA
jgi:hypothetical protein